MDHSGPPSSYCPPQRENGVDCFPDLRTRIKTIDSVRQERVVLRSTMPDVRLHRQIDRAWIEVLCIRRAADPFRVHLACVRGDGLRRVRGSARVPVANLVRKLPDILCIALRPAHCIGHPPALAHLGIIETLLFGTRQRLVCDQNALSLIALSGAAEPQDDGAQR
jgi:hypothetical protein